MGLGKAFSEYGEQCAIAGYLDRKYPSVLWSASCGGMRTSLGVAVKMKRSGYKKGCPDILIFEPRNGYHGLLIELKRPMVIGVVKKGVTSPEQKEFLQKARDRGYHATVCYGAESAIAVIDEYLTERQDDKPRAFFFPPKELAHDDNVIPLPGECE